MNTRTITCALLSLQLVAILQGCHSSTVPSHYSVSIAGESNGNGTESVWLTSMRDSNGSQHTSNALSSSRLCIMTYNLGNTTDADKLEVMAKHIEGDLETTPNFIVFQEVVFSERKFDGAKNSAQVIAKRLDYHCRSTQRDGDREGVAILSKYPFEYYDSLELDAQTSKIFFGYKRTNVMGEFTMPSVGRVRVVTLHLTNWSYETKIRHKQFRETLEWIARRDRQAPADLIILAGDFNIAPESDTWALFHDESVTGGLKFMSYNTENPTQGGKWEPQNRVDYIFPAEISVDLNFRNESILWEQGLPSPSGVLNFRPSDHRPLVHVYDIASSKPSVATSEDDDQSEGTWRGGAYR